MRIAITRGISQALARCELTHVERQPIDLDRARAQHTAYEAALSRLGARIVRLPPNPDFPDCVFVEDAAVVVEEVAVMMRPGAASRQGEVEAVADALGNYRRLVAMEAPGTMDGGDVLRVGKRIFVGRSSRTNVEGIAQLAEALAPHGYSVEGVEVRGCLHLKSAVTQVAESLLLVNPAWVDARSLGAGDWIEVDPAEPYAANALQIGDAVIYPEHFPLTARRLESRGIRLEPVPCDELAKAEGAVTCCSIVFDASTA